MIAFETTANAKYHNHNTYNKPAQQKKWRNSVTTLNDGVKNATKNSPKCFGANGCFFPVCARSTDSYRFQSHLKQIFRVWLTLMLPCSGVWRVDWREEKWHTHRYNNHHQFIYLDEWVISDKTHYNIVINFPFWRINATNSERHIQNIPFSCSLVFFVVDWKFTAKCQLTTAIIGFQSISWEQPYRTQQFGI